MLLAIALSIGAVLPSAQEPGARLEGILLDAHSRPVPGAAVEASVDGTVVRRAASDGSGVFVLTKLPHAEVAVRATTTAPDVGGAFADLRHDDRSFVRIAMMPARAVRGTVVDEQSKPLAGAFVALAVPGPAEFGAVAQAATSDEHGAFVFPHVPIGDAGIRVWLAGRTGRALAIAPEGDCVVTIEVDVGEPQCRTFLLHDASPAQAATAALQVRAFAGASRVPLPPAVARPALDARGAFIVRGWPGADEMRAHVALQGAFVEPMDAKIPPDSGDRTKEFWVTDAATWIARGRLVAEDGLPVGGRHLVASAPSRFDGLGLATTAVTAADGSFELVSPVAESCSFVLQCTDAGVGIAGANPWSADTRSNGCFLPHRPKQVHSLDLVATRHLTAHIVDADGAQVPAAEVLLLGTASQWRCSLGRTSTDAEMRTTLQQSHGDGSGRVDVDAPLPPHGDLVLAARSAQGFASMPIPDGETAADLGELRVERGVTLRGIARRQDGSPWPAARITLESIALGTKNDLLFVADRDGTFTVCGLAPGPAWIGIQDTRIGALHQLGSEPVVEVELR